MSGFSKEQEAALQLLDEQLRPFLDVELPPQDDARWHAVGTTIATLHSTQSRARRAAVEMIVDRWKALQHKRERVTLAQTDLKQELDNQQKQRDTMAYAHYHASMEYDFEKNKEQYDKQLAGARTEQQQAWSELCECVGTAVQRIRQSIKRKPEPPEVDEYIMLYNDSANGSDGEATRRAWCLLCGVNGKHVPIGADDESIKIHVLGKKHKEKKRLQEVKKRRR